VPQPSIVASAAPDGVNQKKSVPSTEQLLAHIAKLEEVRGMVEFTCGLKVMVLIMVVHCSAGGQETHLRQGGEQDHPGGARWQEQTITKLERDMAAQQKALTVLQEQLRKNTEEHQRQISDLKDKFNKEKARHRKDCETRMRELTVRA
jgi:hypothetical protein